MKKMVEIVNLSFKNSQDYFKQSIELQHEKAKFIDTLNNGQRQAFEQLLESVYKLHKLDIEEYIVHTFEITKSVMELR